jgi:SAM-dependent methyltransferase
VVEKLANVVWRKFLEWCARVPYGKRECVICGHAVGKFLPYRNGSRSVPDLMLALGMTGSDVDNFSCPWCHSHDRERHLFLYMREAGIFSIIARSKVLHVAPEKHLSVIIQDAKPEEYIPCDLYPWAPDILKVDLLSLPFPDNHFDVCIANHVLEHVDDDLCAIDEIARVLRPGGYAILQVPYCRGLELSWEDAGICTDEARLQAFGQEDHVRLFGRDVFERIASRGLKSHVKGHNDLLQKYNPERFGVNSSEPFFLFAKAMPHVH